MKKIVRETISHFNMLCGGERVITALSGGADSVSLLLILNELKSELSLTLEACHVNHGLRGRDSDDDELFVRSLCEKLDIPLQVYSPDIRGRCEKHQSIEETARNARYEIFSSLCEDEYVRIATAHTASDNAETVLFNLSRGTGLRGLCGIPPVRNNIIRPLIRCTRDDIIRFLDERSQTYAIDKSNYDDCYSRNKIRNKVIPVLCEINSSLAASISDMCAVLRADDVFLYELAHEGLKKACVGNNQYNSEVLRSLPPPVLHRVLSLILKQNGVSPSSLRINGIFDILYKNSGKINLMKNTFAIAERGLFFIDITEQKYRR